MRAFIALVAVANVVVVQSFPGAMLNGRWPPMRVPQEIRQTASHVAKASEAAAPQKHHLGLGDILRSAVMCCKDMTAKCMACATNQDMSQFCRDHPRIPGCEEIVNEARKRAADAVVNKAVEKVAEAVGGTKAEELVDEYLARNPDAARQSLANLTHGAMESAASLKESMLQSRESDRDDEEPRSKHAFRPTKKRKTRIPSSKRPLVEDDDVLAESDADEDDDAGDDSEENPLTFQNIQRNPWVIAICSLIVTAVSSGIALGALCHARIGSHAREPLLSTSAA